MNKIFGERLKELRVENGLSCRELGRRIGVSGSSILRWEAGQNVILAELLVKLAKHFNVSMGYLFGAEE